MYHVPLARLVFLFAFPGNPINGLLCMAGAYSSFHWTRPWLSFVFRTYIPNPQIPHMYLVRSLSVSFLPLFSPAWSHYSTLGRVMQ